MKEWRGTARFHDLGPGAWTLEADDGTTRPMFGDVPRELDGRAVVVRGTAKGSSFGFGPSGSGGAIEVASVKSA